MPSLRPTIRYGKVQVSTYRTYAHPLAGVTPIPESSFRGRANILLAADVDVEVLGENFLPAYTRGDNSNVVATDTMKNFVHRTTLDYDGATPRGADRLPWRAVPGHLAAHGAAAAARA